MLWRALKKSLLVVAVAAFTLTGQDSLGSADSCRTTILAQKVGKKTAPPKISQKLGGHFTEDEVSGIVENYAAYVGSKKSLPRGESLLKILPDDLVAGMDTPAFHKEAWALSLKAYPELLGELRLFFAKTLIDSLSRHLRSLSTQHLADSFGLATADFENHFGSAESLMAWVEAGGDGSEAAQKLSQSLNATRDKLMSAYAALSKEKGEVPAVEELLSKLLSSSQSLRASGLSQEELMVVLGEKEGPSLFKGLKDLYEQTLSNPVYAEAFQKVHPEQYNHEHNTRIAELLLKHPRLILTAAAPNVPLHEEAFAALKKLSAEKDAPIVVMAEANQPFYLDERLLNKEAEGIYVITQSVYLSPWLRINDLPLTFKRVDPLSPLRAPGMGGPRGQSQIVFHAQQRDEILPTIDNHLLPHRILSTGAITQDFYRGRHVISGVTDQMARERHDIGFVLVEKEAPQSRGSKAEPSGLFHLRHVSYSEDQKGFIDMGRLFTARSSRVARPEAVVAGDLHLGAENEKLIQKLFDYIKEHRPRRLLLHDIFDGRSVNHHESSRPLSRAQKAQRGELNLVEELNNVAEFINEALALDPSLEVVIVPSNHNEWLNRWLNDHSRNLSSPYYALAIELQNQMTNHAGAAPYYGDPLAYYILGRPELVLKDEAREHLWDQVVPISKPKRVRFLQRGESYRVGGTELSLHGDMGPNGSRGSTKGLARTMDSGVIGHTHSPGRVSGIVNVGTLTELPMDYTTGSPSSSANAFAVVYEGDVIQLHHFNPLSGNFANETQRTLPNDQIFPKGYPYALERPAEEAQVDSADQWRDFRGLGR